LQRVRLILWGDRQQSEVHDGLDRLTDRVVMFYRLWIAQKLAQMMLVINLIDFQLHKAVCWSEWGANHCKPLRMEDVSGHVQGQWGASFVFEGCRDCFRNLRFDLNSAI
jgi:hypothetical protein